MSTPILFRTPQQGNLFPRPKQCRQQAAGADRYVNGNRAAAELILSDAAKHGGEQSLMVRWARLVLAGSAPEVSR